jgi:hypothetical protein
LLVLNEQKGSRVFAYGLIGQHHALSYASRPLLVAACAKKERAIDQGQQDIRATPAYRSQSKHERRLEVGGPPEDSYLQSVLLSVSHATQDGRQSGSQQEHVAGSGTAIETPSGDEDRNVLELGSTPVWNNERAGAADYLMHAGAIADVGMRDRVADVVQAASVSRLVEQSVTLKL